MAGRANLWHFNTDVSWNGTLCTHLLWDSLWFLDLRVYLLHKISEVIFSCFLEIDFQLLVLSLFLLEPPDANVGSLEVVP